MCEVVLDSSTKASVYRGPIRNDLGQEAPTFLRLTVSEGRGCTDLRRDGIRAIETSVGLNFQVVAIPLAELVAIYSSRDDALYARMLAPTNRYAARLLEREERRNGLLDLLKGGHLQNTNAPHHTAYAFEAIAFELGMPVGEIDSNDCDRVHSLVAATGARVELFPDVTEKWPVPIADTPDMPLFGVLQPKQIADRHALLAQLGRSDEPYTDDEIALHAAQQIFDAALAAGTDAVVFFH